jgi:predicted  nucleic acid-binding Zn-ribbon protein
MDIISLKADFEKATADLEAEKAVSLKHSADLVAALEQVTALTGERDAAKQEATDAAASFASVSTERDKALENLTAEKARADALEAEKIEFDKAVSAKVTAITGRSGNKPIEAQHEAEEKPKLSGTAGAIEAMKAKGWKIAN